jgi:excisionase family DNA binding protein
MDATPTIEGRVLLTIAQTAKALGCGRSSVYRKLKAKELDAVTVKGIGPRVTARSILRAAGMGPEAATQ